MNTVVVVAEELKASHLLHRQRIGLREGDVCDDRADRRLHRERISVDQSRNKQGARQTENGHHDDQFRERVGTAKVLHGVLHFS